MKKFVVWVILLLSLLISSSHAYSILEFQERKDEIKEKIEVRLDKKLEKFSKAKLQKLVSLIDKLVEKYENNTGLSDEKKMQKLALIVAVREIVEQRIEEYIDPISILIIDDKRCNNCQTEAIISQLWAVPELSNAYIELKDFMDDNMYDFVQESWITALPAVVFETDDISDGLNPYLSELSNGQYSLNVGSTFDPFLERSEKWFKILDMEVLKEIQDSSYIKGNKSAKITWIEYSDLECPFCARLHTNGTPDELIEKYGNDINMIFQHFPLSFHQNAQTAAEILECVGEQKWSSAFYDLIEIVFEESDPSKDFMISEAKKLWVSGGSIETCLLEDSYTQKVVDQMDLGSEVFGVTGTPGNVLINTETWEYDVISWAYPTSSFIEVIDKLME